LFLKIVEKCKPEALFTLPIDGVIPWRKQTSSSLFVFENGVKFNIWDVVSAVLSLIIMSSDEILQSWFIYGLITVAAGLWHMSVALTQPVRPVTHT